ncbi:MAG: helix-turn-helix domain-containing protein [Bacteroidota bacterium]
MIHIGQNIKDLLHQKRIKQAELARRMDTTPQGLNKRLSNSSMNTDSLVDIMQAAGIKSWEVFQDGSPYELFKDSEDIVEESPAAYQTTHQLRLQAARDKIKSLEEKVSLLEQLIQEKDRVISLMENQ